MAIQMYAIVDTNTHVVIAMSLWDGEEPKPGYTGEGWEHVIYVQTDVAWMDWTYVDGVFYPPYVDPRPGLLAQLEQIDKDSLRALRIVVTLDPNVGGGTDEKAELEALEAQAVIIRAELAALDT